MQVEISIAQKSDLETILELQKLAYVSEGKLYGDFTIPPLVEELSSLILAFETSTILKAEINGRLIGSVRGTFKNDTCYIGRLMVHPDVQNKKIGRSLMLALESYFITCKRFELFTGNRSGKNLSLYSKLGFKEFRQDQISNTVALVYLEKLIQ